MIISMGLYVKQTNTRSQLQERIAKELQDRAKEKSLQGDLPDGVDDSNYIKGTKQTTSLAWVWLLIGLAAVGVAVWLVIVSMQQN